MKVRHITSLKSFIGVLAALMILMSFALAFGGIWLLAVGGSPYYLLLALLLFICGVMLMRRSAAAFWVYALVLLATLIWALWEAGLDWWPLAARLDILFVIGCLMLMPWVRRDLDAHSGVNTNGPSSSTSIARTGAWALASTLVVSAAVAAASWYYDPHDVDGTLPSSQAAQRALGQPVRGVPPADWHAYGRTGFGQRFSPLEQFTPSNVANLQIAWQFHTGDVRGQPGDPVETTDEVTPLKIGNRLFFCTPHQSVIALDATTGQQIWRYDPKLEKGLAVQHMTCRGVSYQPPAEAVDSTSAAASDTKPGDCAGKLFLATADGRLIALDPNTGALCLGFGDGKGQINLWANMPNVRPGAYYSTSPVVVTRHLVIVGGTVLDNVSTHEQSGVIRAFNIDTGALVWNWDSGNPDVTTPIGKDDHYTVNSPNSWSISSVDETLGMVYIPMGNQPPDQWGGKRSPAVERFASSVVALDIATGQVRWVFQTVHHDLWDYDVPAQPTLLDLKMGEATVPALVQPTKQGELFVLDRRTGEPLLPVTEVAAPSGAATGDHSARTQPRSTLSFD
ncbi:MAG: PQQ-binding-like beta-propeller repeat protein, partial [Betaproteobacteria bacterium]